MKIPSKYTKISATVLMSLGMSGAMSFSLGVMQHGLAATVHSFPLAWTRAFAVALPASFVLAPLVHKINRHIVSVGE